ncbi:MAG: Hsp20/alpha crystallin family protein [Bacteroidales bacterium]|nr:Hsp20/alpha crystallin family protein [Bacteroidales bacterium]
MLVTRNNRELMPSLFNELLNWGNSFMPEERVATPKMNISETDKDYEMELCVPGLKKEDLSISIDTDNQLVVEMSKENKKEEKEGRKWLRREFSSSQFKQVFTLPENVKREQISAKVEHGILTITMPKFTEDEKKALAQKIDIQ